MARPVAGVRKQTLILTLPGSPKGAKENLEAVLKLLPHACLQAAGAESRPLHAGGVKKLEKDAGVSSRSDPTAGMSNFVPDFQDVVLVIMDCYRNRRWMWTSSSSSSSSSSRTWQSCGAKSSYKARRASAVKRSFSRTNNKIPVLAI